MEYELRPDWSCETCGIDGDATPLTMLEPDGFQRRRGRSSAYAVCRLCAETLAGNCADDSESYRDPLSRREMYLHVNKVVNLAVREIVAQLKAAR